MIKIRVVKIRVVNDYAIKIRVVNDRVIKIRIITDSNAIHSMNLKEKMGCDIKMNDNPGSGKMHHKFVIIDNDNNNNDNINNVNNINNNNINNKNNKSKLLTGSLNWSEAGIRYNHENVLVIENEKVINSHQIEFNELWNTFRDYEPAMDGANDAPNDGANY